MGIKLAIALSAIVFTATAFATFDLAGNGKKVVCVAEDNIIITLNAKRTTLKYMVEGESNGPENIDSFQTDGKHITYRAGEMALTLGPTTDEFKYDEFSDFGPVDCR
jgi:hypothetical protein